MLDSKRFLQSGRAGFTLVEFLIVIMIIGVLSTLAVSGYTQYRKSALLDLAGDNLISQINELREKTIRGDFDSERFEAVVAALESGDKVVEGEIVDEAQCFGIQFESGAGLESFAEDFIGKKVFEGGDWVYDGCGGGDLMNERVVELGDQVVIDEVVLVDAAGGKRPVNNFLLRFLPPNGEVEVEIDGRNFDFKNPLSEKFVSFQISYGETEDLKFKRAVLFDFISLNATAHEAN